MKKIVYCMVVVLILTSCTREDDRTPTDETEKAYMVRVVRAIPQDVPATVELAATLEADEELTISAEVEGTIRSVLRDEGDRARKDEPLALMDEADFRLRMEEKEAELEKIRAELGFAQKELERRKELLEEGIVSRQEYERFLVQRDSLASLKRAVESALQIERRKLEDSRIKAPFDGIVAERYITEGSYVRKGDRLFRFLRIDPLKLTINVPERRLKEVEQGQKVLIRVDPYGKEFEGRIYFTSPYIDRSTKTFLAKALVENRDGLLYPGISADVTIMTALIKGGFVVPEKAVIFDEEGRILFVVKDGVAEKRRIRTVGRFKGEVIVVEGVKEGELLVVDGASALTDGAKVKIIE